MLKRDFIASTYIFQFSPNTLRFISTKFNIIHPLRSSHTYFPDAHKGHPTSPPFIHNAPQPTNDILAATLHYYRHNIITRTSGVLCYNIRGSRYTLFGRFPIIHPIYSMYTSGIIFATHWCHNDATMVRGSFPPLCAEYGDAGWENFIYSIVSAICRLVVCNTFIYWEKKVFFFFRRNIGISTKCVHKGWFERILYVFQ